MQLVPAILRHDAVLAKTAERCCAAEVKALRGDGLRVRPELKDFSCAPGDSKHHPRRDRQIESQVARHLQRGDWKWRERVTAYGGRISRDVVRHLGIPG